MNENTSNCTLILGGGFTGLLTALHLSHQHYTQSTILIEQEERFVFKPLLYEFLTDEMDTDTVCPRYDRLLHNSGVAFVQDTVEAIDLHQRQVKLCSGLHYQYARLVLALGSTIGYFGTPGAPENTFSFRTGKDAIALGRHLRDCIQRASQTEDCQKRRSLLTVGIIGAGPTGVELAATLADLLPSWYAPLGGYPQEIRIVLINRGKDILSGDINAHLRQIAMSALQQRQVPVELLLEAAVIAVSPNGVEYKRNNQFNKLEAATIVWTAGTATHPLIENLPIPQEHRDKHGRIRVNDSLQIPDFPEVFAAGDCAMSERGTVDRGHEAAERTEDKSQPKKIGKVLTPLPPTAQVAYQQGAAIAHNLIAIARGHTPKPAKVNLRGTLMKLGLGEGVANIFDRIEVKGKVGNLIRQGAYLELLPTPIHNFKATTEWLTNEIIHLR
jgi:NADH dehydrogenase FAD-containing subunit